MGNVILSISLNFNLPFEKIDFCFKFDFKSETTNIEYCSKQTFAVSLPAQQNNSKMRFFSLFSNKREQWNNAY